MTEPPDLKETLPSSLLLTSHNTCSTPSSSTENRILFPGLSSTRRPHRPHPFLTHRLGQVAPSKPCSKPSPSLLSSSAMGSVPLLQTRPASPNSDNGFDPLAFDQDLTPLPVYKAAGDAALNFGGLLPASLRVHEDLASGCGGQTWPAGVVLARHMLRYHRDDLEDASM